MQVDHELRARHTKLVHIRIYENAQDWWHKREISFPCTSEGSLDIEKLQSELEVEGTIRVCDSD
jgi:hypothetical protein